LQHAYRQPADDHDQHDQNAGDGIAAHELAGTIHRAEEIRLLGDDRAACSGFILADESGVEIGVDRHLLAGHGVQRETRTDFGNPSGTLGDHHEIDNDQDDEQDNADGVIASYQEMTEGLDHLASGVGAGVPFEQHDPGGRNVERQPQQRGHQQHGGKYGEFKRLGGIQADQQHDHRQCDVESEQQVEQDRRQRQDHHAQNHDNQDRAGQFFQAKADRPVHSIDPGVHAISLSGSRPGGTGRL